MQRLLSQQLLAQLRASATQLSQPAAPAMVQQQLPCLASFAGSLMRHASSAAAPPGGEAAAEPDALSAEAAGGADAPADADTAEAEEEIDLDDDFDLTDRGLEEALKFRGGVPERRGRKPTRAEKGSYIDNADLEQELADIATKVPDDISLYDLRTAAPGLYLPRSDALEEMLKYGKEHMDELLADIGANPEDVDLLHAGQRPILHWKVRMRLDTSGEPNLVNRKAECKVYLRELQEETGLTDAALQHIARVAGPRYNPNKGELTLVSERHPEREENRIHIMDMLHALIAEGERVHPSDKAAEGETEPQQAAQAGAE